MSARKEALRKIIVEVLKEAEKPVTFEELFNGVSGRLGDVRKFELREVLSELIREGLVKREPDYERRRMVFRLSS